MYVLKSLPHKIFKEKAVVFWVLIKTVAQKFQHNTNKIFKGMMPSLSEMNTKQDVCAYNLSPHPHGEEV